MKSFLSVARATKVAEINVMSTAHRPAVTKPEGFLHIE